MPACPFDRGANGRVIATRDEHDRDVTAFVPQPFFELETTDARQLDIEDGAIRLAALRQVSLCGPEDADVVAT